MATLYEQHRLCDVTIIVQKEEFPCHRAVLAAASGYFDAMFSSQMTEAKSERVSISEIKPDVFRSVLKFIYFGSSVISTESVESLLHAACMFQITPLQSDCEEFLLEQLAVENCIGFWVTGMTYSCCKLEQESWTFITENFDLVCKSEELLKLEINELMKIIKSNELNTSSEENVCKAAVNWIKHDENSRRDQFSEILKELRLCQVSLEFLLDELYSIKYMLGNETCSKLVKDAIKYHALPERRHMSDSLKVRPRNRSSVVEMAVVLGRRRNHYGENGTEFIGYSVAEGKWFVLSPLPLDLEEDFATCLYGDDIFVSGGTANMDVFYRFCSSQFRWTKKRKMEIGRYRHNMVAVRNCLFVLGGYNFGTVSSVEKYDISTDSWETVGELHHAVDAAASSVHGDKIYTFGGVKSFSRETDAIQCYDTVTNTCFLVGSLPSPQSKIKAAIYNDQTYLAFPNGELYAFKPNSRLHLAHKADNLDLNDCGFIRDATACYFVGGSKMAMESEEVDACDECVQLSDVIKKVSIDETSEPTSLPAKLPLPLAVYGCFKTVIKRKYPLSEIKEFLEYM